MRVQTNNGDTIGVTRSFNPRGSGCLEMELSNFTRVRIHLTDEERIELALQVLTGGDSIELSAALARNPSGKNVLRLLVENSDNYVLCPSCGSSTHRHERKTCSGCSNYLEGM